MAEDRTNKNKDFTQPSKGEKDGNVKHTGSTAPPPKTPREVKQDEQADDRFQAVDN